MTKVLFRFDSASQDCKSFCNLIKVRHLVQIWVVRFPFAAVPVYAYTCEAREQYIFELAVLFSEVDRYDEEGIC